MSDDNNNFWQWIARILGSIIGGVIVYYLTEGLSTKINEPTREPTNTPSSTPASPPISISITPPPIPRIPPEEEVNSYFNDINNRLYQAAWDRLPTTLQTNKNFHPEGFKSFEKWYEKMNSVDVIEVNVAENYSNRAEVNTRIVYNFKDGRTGTNSLRFLLSWDSQEEKWRITEFKKN